MTTRSEGLTVFVRVRPPILKEVKEETAVSIVGKKTILLTNIENRQEVKCTYDRVFNEISDQPEVFDSIQPLMDGVLVGINSCIFAYGQTSAGKSYTMLGPNGGHDLKRCDKSKWGILPRASEYLLGYLNAKAEEGLLSFELKASFLQIYNENLYDLLRDSGPMIEDHLQKDDSEYDLKIRELPKRKGDKFGKNEVYVAGLSEFRVQTSEDILRIVHVGTSNRMTRSTDFNATSSRSHAILQLTFEIEKPDSLGGQVVIYRSKLNLVDLAGSEKTSNNSSTTPLVYDNTNKHMKELTSINKSLSCLGNVIAALSSGTRSHVPYRDSKLTRILQDSLGGTARTVLIACVAPTVLHTSETFSTLQFADRAKSVMLSVKANTVIDEKNLLVKAQSEIVRLKELLSHALKQKGSVDGTMPADGLSQIESSYAIETLKQENTSLRKEIKTLKTMLKNKSSGQNRSLDDGSGGYEAAAGSEMKPFEEHKSYQNHLPTAPHPTNPSKARAHSASKSRYLPDVQAMALHVDPSSVVFDPILVQLAQRSRSPEKRVRPDGESPAKLPHLANKSSLMMAGPPSKGNAAATRSYKNRPGVVATSFESGLNDPHPPHQHPSNGMGPKPSPSSIEEIINANSRIQQQQIQQILHNSSARPGANYPMPTSHGHGQFDPSSASSSASSGRPSDYPANDIMARFVYGQSNQPPAVNASMGMNSQSYLMNGILIHNRNDQMQANLQPTNTGNSPNRPDSSEARLTELNEMLNNANKKMKQYLDSDYKSFNSIIQNNGKALPINRSFGPTSMELKNPIHVNETVKSQKAVESFNKSNENDILILPKNLDSFKLPDLSARRTTDKESMIVEKKSFSNPINDGRDNSMGNEVQLTYSKADIGMSVLMFSFRMTTWDRIDVLDFEPSKNFHKIRLMDGSTQWVDLKKKPIRPIGLQ